MNKRDWQADMTECQMWQTRTTSSLPSIGIHWLQQYAVWEAKAYGAEAKAREAEAREMKLREAIEEEVKCHILLGTYKRADELRELLASLYPKEETE